ncbi:interferon-related developmental regulator 2-like [Babylonia areolata]|uniref:interferon-related developmental regulator 2-like n=1 Tax=Babylonia areolata TaxID=304850 RepID=UPI003FD2408C
MPKNNKKRGAQRKGQGAGATSSHPPTDEENSTAGDNWSTASVLSDSSSTYDGLTAEREAGEDQQDGEDNVEQENFEDRMCECIEGLLVKSAPQRKKSLEGLKSGLCKKYCVDFLQKRKETVADSLLKCLKKGKAEEQSLAARCLSLLAVQLGEEVSQVYSDVQTSLATLLADSSAHPHTRAQCASTMGIFCFVNAITNDDDVTELSTRMGLMEAVFKTSYRNKANGSLPPPNPQLTEISISCLDAWCLLLTRAPDYFIQDKAQSHISLLGDLLQSSDTELRIAAGEAIALLFDLNRYIDEGFDESREDTDLLCDQLKTLSTESTKHKARNALRQQRARFRDILQTVQDGVVEEVLVKMGSMETLMLEDWSTKVQYNAFCSALHSGIFVHLKENLMLRDFFDLGAPIPSGTKPVHKMSKVQRKYYNSLAEKARTQSRAKNRDKRSVVVGF